MSRPAPRKSSLSGQSIFAPQPAAEAPQEAPAAIPAPAAPAAAPKAATAPQSAAEPQKPAPRSKPKKLTIYQEPEDTDRMRGAMVATVPYTGFTTLSKFVQDAIMEKVERLEQQYNEGKPFPAVGPGVIPAGRPMGE